MCICIYAVSNSAILLYYIYTVQPIDMEQVLEFDPPANSTLIFKGPTGGGKTASITVRNPTDLFVGFKVRTTVPKLCVVRPNQYMMDPHEETIVNLIFSPADSSNPSAKLDWTQHKFMIQAISLRSKCDVMRLDYVISRNKDEIMISRWNSELEAVKGVNLEGELVESKKTIGALEKALETEKGKNKKLQEELEVIKETVKPNDISFWETSCTDVTINETAVINKGDWGYTATGAYKDQPVSVTCLEQSSFDDGILRKEVAIMAKVRHPCLLLFIAVSFDDPSGSPMIITESIECSLKDAFQDPKQLSFNSRMSILIDIARALHYLHTHRDTIIHGGVTSDNMFVYKTFETSYRGKLSCFNIKALINSKEALAKPDDKVISIKEDVRSYGLLVSECFKKKDMANYPLLKLPRILEQTANCMKYDLDEWPDIYEVMSALKDIAAED